MCATCDGEGDFLVQIGFLPWENEYVDCDDCRGLGWVDQPEEDEDERISDSS